MPTTDSDALLTLAADLIRRPSVTPEDAGCQQLLAERLAASGFIIEHLRIGEVDNLWARRGNAGPLLVFAGHTDVVPTGPLAAWRRPPFDPEIVDGMLHGRGASDMKGSLAAMVLAVEDLLERHPQPAGSIGFLITSDEEGPAVNGTRAVMDLLLARGERIDYCLVGEPSSSGTLGDVVRIGRRGSLNAELTVLGIQGHVAYPEAARNPIHEGLAALDELARRCWDQGNEHFPPTSFQISNIEAGTGATNVVPGSMRVLFNFRFCTEQTAAGLEAATEAVLRAHGLEYEVRWTRSGEPFLTASGALIDAVRDVIGEVSGVEPELSTGGGTSDGRFIAPHGVELVELGPCNATIHQLDECVPVAHLIQLTRAYRGIAERLLVPAAGRDDQAS